MSDHADDCLDDAVNGGYWLDPYTPHSLDRMYDEETGIFTGPGRTYLKRCRCCGKHGLHWEKCGGKWRLLDGEFLHQCPVNPLNP